MAKLKVLDRDQRISEMKLRSQDLEEGAERFKKKAKELKWKAKMAYARNCIILILIIFLLILIPILIFLLTWDFAIWH